MSLCYTTDPNASLTLCYAGLSLTGGALVALVALVLAHRLVRP